MTNLVKISQRYNNPLSLFGFILVILAVAAIVFGRSTVREVAAVKTASDRTAATLRDRDDRERAYEACKNRRRELFTNADIAWFLALASVEELPAWSPRRKIVRERSFEQRKKMIVLYLHVDCQLKGEPTPAPKHA